MPVAAVAPGIHYVGVNDRTTDLFEGLWPIAREGVSYNSYLVLDERPALIDLVKSIKVDDYLAQIAACVDPAEIAAIVVNHMEPDHAGLLSTFRRIAPRARIVGTAKTAEFLASWLGLTENVQIVNDGDTLSLGRRSLRFLSTPFLHWPETMMTYAPDERVLFSCDAFGGYGAIRNSIFDDECGHLPYYEQEALRYFANIVANYSARVLSAAEKMAGLPIDVIAPSHGLVWRGDPRRIVDLYAKWSGYAAGPAEPGVTLLFGSMYGSTERAMNAVARGVTAAGVRCEIFDVARTHVSYILPSLWTLSGVLIGAPTYEVRLFPPMAEVLEMAARKRILNRTAGYFGSHGWSGGALKEVRRIVEPLQWRLGPALEFAGSPTPDDLEKAEAFGKTFGESLKG